MTTFALVRPAFSSPALQFMGRRVRQRAFWYVQGMIAVIAGTHYGLEIFAHGAGPGYLHHIPVILFIFPIVYAGLRYGWEGSLLTGAWVAILTAPNIVFYHRHELEWVIESIQIGVSLIVGIVVAMLVKRAETARERAEELAQRAGRVNRLILQAQEEERLRIARDLHDGPVQTLVYLCHCLDKSGRPEGPIATSADAREAAESALAEVRAFSRDLRPSILDDLGLVAALEWLVRSASERVGLCTDFYVRGEPRRLPAETELALFRIAQEAVRNAHRHSGAEQVTIELAFDSDDDWALRICDNGCGFDPNVSMSEFSARGHLGLNGMYERAHLVGAELAIRTRPGAGTVVEVASGAAASQVPRGPGCALPSLQAVAPVRGTAAAGRPAKPGSAEPGRGAAGDPYSGARG